MTRSEIIAKFRAENAEITDRVISDTVLNTWCIIGDKDVCAKARLIVDQDGTTIETSEDDQYWDLTDKIEKFYSLDEYPGGGVTYNNKRLTRTTIAKLDSESSNWRSRSSGTPKEFYTRGQWIYMDRPIDSNEYDLKVYSVLIPDDFDDDSKTPYNQITMYEPYHPALIFYLTYRAKVKIGKQQDSMIAKKEYEDYVNWIKKSVGGMKYSSISLRPVR